MKKPTQAEVIAALRSDNPDEREAMVTRLTEKRPPHRPQNPTAPYNRAALLGVLFSFLKNAEDVRGLHAGVMPLDGLPFDAEYADDLIARLSPVAANSVAEAIRMTVEWFGKHGISVTENTIKKAFYDNLQRGGSITTPAEWASLKKQSSEVIDRN